MRDQELRDWHTLQKQFTESYHLSNSDWQELIRLNHLLMEKVNEIHNANMTALLERV